MNAKTTAKGLHITIGATPGGGRRLLEGEIQLLKAALLYGDHVLLCSPGSSLLASLVVFAELASTADHRGQVELTRQLVPSFFTNELDAQKTLAFLEYYAGVLSKKRGKRLSKEEIILQFQLRPQFQRVYHVLQEKIETLAEEAGLGEIVVALESGMLELRFLDTANDTEGSDALIKEYVDVISDAVADGTSFPLLDDLTGNLIRAAIGEGRLDVSDVAVKRGVHAGLMSDLLGRLPLFDQATTKEVLDIRRELERPLVRFRSAISQYAITIGSAPWADVFPAEAERVFLSEVHPAVLDIEDSIKANRYLLELVSRYAKKPETFSIPVLALLMAQYSSLPEMVSLGMGATAVAAQATDVFKEWKARQREIEKNQLFFYYKAGQMLRV